MRGKSASAGLKSWCLYWLITKLIAHVGNLNFDIFYEVWSRKTELMEHTQEFLKYGVWN